MENDFICYGETVRNTDVFSNITLHRPKWEEIPYVLNNLKKLRLREKELKT